MNIKTQVKNIIFKRCLAALFLAGLFVLANLPVPLLAQTVLQGYQTDQQLQRGMLVTLKEDDQSKVEAITDKTIDRLKGVVADPNDSPVTISAGNQKVFVATSGSYEVLVSNENGKIKQGDYLSGSSLAGIAMKADDTSSVVLGRAVGNFDGGGDSVGRSTSKDGRTLEFGRIQGDIGVGKNPLLKEPEKDNILGVLQNVGSAVSEKPVNPQRVYLAFILLLITAGVAAVMLISGVRNAIISLGRNPFSKDTILKGLFQVLLITLIIFITGLFGVYLLIKL